MIGGFSASSGMRLCATVHMRHGRTGLIIAVRSRLFYGALAAWTGLICSDVSNRWRGKPRTKS